MNPFRILWLAMVLAVYGCGASAAPSDFVEGCTSATLGALTGVTPRITWPEDCGVAVITVVPVELIAQFGGSMWAISGDGNNVLRSGSPMVRSTTSLEPGCRRHRSLRAGATASSCG